MRTRIRTLLGPLDPMRAEPPAPLGSPAFEERRDERGRPAVGRWVLAAAVVAVVGMVVWLAASPNAPRGTAATPEQLVITAPATPTPAAQRLAELAERARASGLPAVGGTTEYVEMRAWYLNSQVSGGDTVSAVVPEIHRTWRAADGSGRAEKESAEFRGTDHDEWPPGGRTPSFGAGRLPTTADAMAGYLYRPNPPDAIGPIKTFVAVHDLLKERVLTAAERAAVLEVVAQLPGLTYQGVATDRVGRTAEVFAMDSDYGGLPCRYTLLVSPDSGMILGTEEVLTTTAGALNVSIPAVVRYEAYVRAEFR